ncbi:MAG TPA: transporter associated domain-containing protein [Coxiellaceae bacterium]|nr:transporter associated domain-containing protein [Coxiellaceae bacterium]
MSNAWFEKISHFFSREPSSQAQLIEVLRHAEEHELIDRDALKMIEGVLAVSDKKVRDVMVPRAQMVVIDGDATPSDAFPIVTQSQHSRFPVTGDTPDKIIGILLAKDLLSVIIAEQSAQPFIRNLIRTAIFIPDSKHLDVLLKEFRQNRNHMAIVVDEYGSVSGLITIEDVLEEIVGEIEDEYDIDENESSIRAVEENTYWVNALTTIDDFNRYFQTQLSNEDFDTIGGLILQKFGYLPKRNDKIKFDNFEVTVIKASRRGTQVLQFKRVN